MPHLFSLSLIAISLFCILLIPSGCTSNQQVSQQEAPQCTLEKSQAPELRGFRLGMDLNQIQKRFSGLKVKEADEFGLRKIVLEGSKTVPADKDVSDIYSTDRALVNTTRFPEFADINIIVLELMDDHITSIDITYPHEPPWGTYDVFAAHIAKSLNLPDEKEWRHHQGMASVTCRGFEVWAGFRVRTVKRDPPDVRANPFILLQDNDASRTLEDRKQTKREKEKERLKDFKP